MQRRTTLTVFRRKWRAHRIVNILPPANNHDQVILSYWTDTSKLNGPFTSISTGSGAALQQIQLPGILGSKDDQSIARRMVRRSSSLVRCRIVMTARATTALPVCPDLEQGPDFLSVIMLTATSSRRCEHEVSKRMHFESIPGEKGTRLAFGLEWRAYSAKGARAERRRSAHELGWTPAIVVTSFVSLAAATTSKSLGCALSPRPRQLAIAPHFRRRKSSQS